MNVLPALASHAPIGDEPRPAITDFGLVQLTAELQKLGLTAFRARQIFHGVHGRHARSWDDLTDLPVALRADLAQRYRLSALGELTRQRAADGTTKYLLGAFDGQAIETVHIPAGRGEADGERLTVCVSSQAGCALACRFCATGQMGFARDLTIGEIVEQIYRAERPGAPREVDNVVFMGMGEPMANYDAVVGAIRVLAEPLGYGLSPRRVTVSTSGLVPEMDRLAGEGLAVRLAVSLHAPSDELRTSLMPINRRYPIREVVTAADRYAAASGRRVSYEYVMLGKVNDGDEQADQLGHLLAGRNAHVNLIPYNQTASGFDASRADRIRVFAERVQRAGVPCTIRASRGQDIAAACGQHKAEKQRVAAIRRPERQEALRGSRPS
jgi:23S rRNA (adenine2503-C2)-methyltransferase